MNMLDGRVKYHDHSTWLLQLQVLRMLVGRMVDHASSWVNYAGYALEEGLESIMTLHSTHSVQQFFSEGSIFLAEVDVCQHGGHWKKPIPC
jgi:hypothetical protein